METMCLTLIRCGWTKKICPFFFSHFRMDFFFFFFNLSEKKNRSFSYYWWSYDWPVIYFDLVAFVTFSDDFHFPMLNNHNSLYQDRMSSKSNHSFFSFVILYYYVIFVRRALVFDVGNVKRSRAHELRHEKGSM